MDWSGFCQKEVFVFEVENLNITGLVAEKWWYNDTVDGSEIRLTSWISRYPIIYDGLFSHHPFPVAGTWYSRRQRPEVPG